MAVFQSVCVDPNEIMASGSAQVFPSEVVMTHSVYRETSIYINRLYWKTYVNMLYWKTAYCNKRS